MSEVDYDFCKEAATAWRLIESMNLVKDGEGTLEAQKRVNKEKHPQRFLFNYGLNTYFTLVREEFDFLSDDEIANEFED